jgi:hypothetical protein
MLLLILERMRATVLPTVRRLQSPRIHRFRLLSQRINLSGIRPSHRPAPGYRLCLRPCRVRQAFLL